MRILVMQTTRMGDVIQTSPLIRVLRMRHPDAHIALMVRNMGKAIAERNPDVDEVLVYEEDEMFNATRTRDSDRLLYAYRCAEAEIHRLKEGRYDAAYNCTHSIASAMLIKLAEIPVVFGAHLSDDWQFVLRGSWIKYFFTSVFHREYNDLNLCDITQRFAEGAEPCRNLVLEVTAEDRDFVREILEKHGVGPDDFLVCFQLGASEESKRWPEMHFAGLARLVRDKLQAKIMLVGVKEEEILGKIFDQYAPELAVPLFGKTSVPQLAALLNRANLLVTNDTGTMHIAAAVHCPVVLVSVGYVHFRETGPYGAGHCAIERRRSQLGRADGVPGGLNERMEMHPEQVLRAIEMTLQAQRDESVTQVDKDAELSDVDILMTRFAADGCLQWYPVLRRTLTETDFLRIAYRAMWLEHLGAQTDPQIERKCMETTLRYYTLPDKATLDHWKGNSRSALAGLAGVAGRGIQWTETLLSHLGGKRDLRKAQQFVSELTRIDDEMRIHGELHGPCKPLVLISRYERDNLEGANPLELAQTTRQIYDDCRSRALLTAQKIDRLAALCATD
jgi:ADP-heptose:LPS heptosyltransferase